MRSGRSLMSGHHVSVSTIPTIPTGEYDMTGVFAWWSGNYFELNITGNSAANTLTVTIAELVAGGNVRTIVVNNVNLTTHLGCGASPAPGTCTAYMGMTAGEPRSMRLV